MLREDGDRLHLHGKFLGNFVPIDQDRPYEEMRGTGNLRQLPHLRHVGTGEHV